MFSIDVCELCNVCMWSEPNQQINEYANGKLTFFYLKSICGDIAVAVSVADIVDVVDVVGIVDVVKCAGSQISCFHRWNVSSLPFDSLSHINILSRTWTSNRAVERQSCTFVVWNLNLGVLKPILCFPFFFQLDGCTYPIEWIDFSWHFFLHRMHPFSGTQIHACILLTWICFPWNKSYPVSPLLLNRIFLSFRLNRSKFFFLLKASQKFITAI